MLVARGFGQGGLGSIVAWGMGIAVIEIVVPEEGDRAHGWLQQTRVSTITICDPDADVDLFNPDHDIVISTDPIPIGIDSSIIITNPQGEIELEKIVHVVLEGGFYDEDGNYDTDSAFDFHPDAIHIKSITGRNASITVSDVQAVVEALQESGIEAIVSGPIAEELDQDSIKVNNPQQTQQVKRRVSTIDIEPNEDP